MALGAYGRPLVEVILNILQLRCIVIKIAIIIAMSSSIEIIIDVFQVLQLLL